jgi:hypothetical protein
VTHYIISNKHNDGGLVRLFWRPNGDGYTYNLHEAGLFDRAIYAKQYPVITKENIQDQRKYDYFLISPVDLGLLGPMWGCIRN